MTNIDRKSVNVWVVFFLFASVFCLQLARAEPCPVQTNKQAKERFFYDYHGKRHHFCCQKCRLKFKLNPERYISAAPAVSTETKSARLGFVESLGRFHPLLVHFPIALAFFALFLEFFTAQQTAVGVTCAAAALSAILTAALGWAAGSAPDVVQHDLAWYLQFHRWAGIATALVLSATALCAKRTGLRRAGLILGCILVLCTGAAGGILVYGLDHFSGLFR